MPESTMAAAPILEERFGAVHRISLNRPARSNCLEPELVEGLGQALEKARKDTAVHVVVLTGSGRAFCAGLDLGYLVDHPDKADPYLRGVLDLFWRVWEFPQPVVAAINGPAVAGGFDLASFCDLRVATEDAVFAQPEILLGLVPIVHPLYKSIGLGHAKELALFGERIDAKEAHRIGYLNQVWPTDGFREHALEYAQRLALRSRAALGETKRLTRELIDLKTRPAVDEFVRTITSRLKTEEHRMALAAYYAKLTKK